MVVEKSRAQACAHATAQIAAAPALFIAVHSTGSTSQSGRVGIECLVERRMSHVGASHCAYGGSAPQRLLISVFTACFVQYGRLSAFNASHASCSERRLPLGGFLRSARILTRVSASLGNEPKDLRPSHRSPRDRFRSLAARSFITVTRRSSSATAPGT